MTLRVSASSVKSWFQYRCERKFVYECMDDAARKAVPVLESVMLEPWARFGRDYEDQVLARLRGEGRKTLEPAPGSDALSPNQTAAFCRGEYGAVVAYQLLLESSEAARNRLGLQKVPVEFKRGKADLVLLRMVDGKPVLRIVDIKSTREALPFHKTQVAWYSILLGGMLTQAGIDATVDSVGEIWHLPLTTNPEPGEYVPSEFRLGSYESIIEDWAHHELRTAARKRVTRGVDETSFHVYFKCEQCKFSAHCERSIADSVAPKDLDVSAIAGLSQQSKALLWSKGIKTVGRFVERWQQVLSSGHSDWLLSTRGEELMARADALLHGAVAAIPNHVSLRIPPRAEVKVLLLVDRDPMASRLSSLSVRILEQGTQSEVKEVITSHAEERAALLSVLGAVRDVMKRVHAGNERGSRLVMHFYVYEPVEGRDIAEALGRHLDDAALVAGLLELIRVFPPDEAIPEPEYRGFHHLPTGAVRSVLEEVFALPAKVSWDLRRASAALSRHPRPPAHPYQPTPDFEQRFSSRMPLPVCRELEAGTRDRSTVVDDLTRRLEALQGMVEWLERENEFAPADRKFLRLNKAPFRLYASLPPLRARHLEVLRAQVLLETRGGLVSTLHTLAQPLERRISRQACLADLQLRKHGRTTNGDAWLRFEVPMDRMGSDVRASEPMLLLTDGHPDRVLDQNAWPSFRVEWKQDPNYPPHHVFLFMDGAAFDSDGFQKLFTAPSTRWVIDKAHFDVNGARLDSFLQHIDGEVA